MLPVFQFIQRNLNNISARTSQANEQLGQMSSGKRVEHASDDPVSANGILNYKQELRKLDSIRTISTWRKTGCVGKKSGR
ncbi:hypothetical protein MBH78_12105 [Oceanimonas sp. NS1]|nr:hypothetical protein [Oceanimonas sp. NS1]